jgi:hypothetical protein
MLNFDISSDGYHKEQTAPEPGFQWQHHLFSCAQHDRPHMTRRACRAPGPREWIELLQHYCNWANFRIILQAQGYWSDSINPARSGLTWLQGAVYSGAWALRCDAIMQKKNIHCPIVMGHGIWLRLLTSLVRMLALGPGLNLSQRHLKAPLSHAGILDWSTE